MLLTTEPPDPGSFQFGLGGLLLTVFSTIVVALLATAGVIYAARQSRGAQDKTAEIDSRRLKLDEAEANRRYDRELNERLNAEIVRLNAEVDRLERLGNSRAAAQAVRCRAALSHLSESLEALVTVVRNEVEAEAARDAINTAGEHTANDHPEQP